MKSVYLVFSFEPCKTHTIEYTDKSELWDNICRLCSYLEKTVNLHGCKFGIFHTGTGVNLANYEIDNYEFFEL